MYCMALDLAPIVVSTQGAREILWNSTPLVPHMTKKLMVEVHLSRDLELTIKEKLQEREEKRWCRVIYKLSW